MHWYLVLGFVWALALYWRRRRAFKENRRLSAVDGRHRDPAGGGGF
jgi:hypothetical protein